MIPNHIIIGLGGTGGQSLKELRETISIENKSFNIPNTNIEYLYIDSNNNDIDGSEEWLTKGGIAGDDIGLGRANHLLIKTQLGDRLRNLSHYPITKRYIGGTPSMWDEISASVDLQSGAGEQIRRVGAAIFEPHVADFNNRIQQLVSKLAAKTNDRRVNFHIITGLSGGTGSGIFLHVLAQLRALFSYRSAQSIQYPITLYAIIPKFNDHKRVNIAEGKGVNYYANAYAAFEELNAYLIDHPDNPDLALCPPYDLTGESQRFEPDKKQFDLKDRVQACYLISSENEMNYNIPLEQLPRLTAQFIYQRLSTIDSLAGNQDYTTLTQAVSEENFRGIARTADKKYQAFKAFGIKRIIVPEIEVNQYFSNNISYQSLLKILYNNWDHSDDKKYLNYPSNRYNFSRLVQEDLQKEAWKLTDSYLTLSTPILEDEYTRRWKTLDEYWRLVSNSISTDYAKHKIDNDLFKKLEAAFQKDYNQVFRREGVDDFFNTSLQELKTYGKHSSEITHKITTWFYDKWQDESYAINDLIDLLDALINNLRERDKQFSNKRSKLVDTIYDLKNKIKAHQAELNTVGFMGFLAGKREKIKVKYIADLEEYFYYKTSYKSMEFSIAIIKKVISELSNNLKPKIINIRTFLKSDIKKIDDLIKNSFTEENNTIKLFKPEKVKLLVNDILTDENNQRNWSQQIRNTIESSLLTIKDKQQDTSSNIFDLWEKYYRHNEFNTHINSEINNIVQQEHSQRINESGAVYKSHILDKLQQECPDDQTLRRYIQDIVRSAQTLAVFDQNQYANRPSEVMLVTLPEYPQNQEYYKKVEKTFLDTQAEIQIVKNSRNKINEIILVSIRYGFPLHYLDTVQQLKTFYKNRIKDDVKKAKLQLYIHDHSPIELPSILKQTQSDRIEHIIKYFSIAISMKLFEKVNNEYLGKTEYKINDYGLKDP